MGATLSTSGALQRSSCQQPGWTPTDSAKYFVSTSYVPLWPLYPVNFCILTPVVFQELGRFQKSFQIDLGSDDGVERGLQGSIGVGCVNVAALAEESHGLVAFGTSRGTVEFWDSRSRARVATLDTHDGEISALDFSRSGLSLATGCSSGIVQIYDLRRPTPLLTKDLGFGYPVKNLQHLTTASEEKKILASDKRAIKIFDETDGTPWTTIEPEADINSVAYCPNSGMLLSANEGRQQHAWFIPMLVSFVLSTVE